MRFSIRFKLIVISTSAILAGLLSVFATVYSVFIQEYDKRSVEMMNLIGDNTSRQLDKYFQSIEQSVEMAAYIASDSLDSVFLIENGIVGTEAGETTRTVRQIARLDAQLASYCDTVQKAFSSVAGHTQGVVTYYYCIVPEISNAVHGFYYSRVGKAGFTEQEPLVASEQDPDDLEHTAWYHTAIKRGRPSWIGPYKADLTDEIWVCSYVVPIYKSGDLIGVLGMDIPLETLVEQVSSLKIYDTGFACLLDENARVIYHPEFEMGTVLDLQGISLFDVLYQEDNGNEMIRYYAGNQQRQMSFTTIPNGMKLFIIAPVSEINASVSRMISIIIPASGLIILVVIIVLMFVIGNITRPLQNLTAASKRLAAAEYDVELNYKGKDEVGEMTVAFTTMRDKIKLYIDDLNRRVHMDDLTGLPNRRYFFELAEKEKQRLYEAGKKPVIVYINIIGMKHYNRQYGLESGDKLIFEFGKIFAKHFQKLCVCRLSQDHFAAISEEPVVKHELNEIFRECRMACDGASLPLRAGVYQYKLEDVNVNIAIDRAKYACDQYRGYFISEFYYFDVNMMKELDDARYIISYLDEALEKQWIKAYYQKIIYADNGKVADEETLARWIDPEKGMISPGKFVPILENARLVYKLDLYMLDQILLKLHKLKKEGKELVPHSLNISRADFDSCDIVQEICKRIDASGIERKYITIEITESMVGSDFDFMKGQVGRLRSLGFKVWMDDFGNGYSALDVLQDIQFDVIKFDMRFMKRFEDSNDSRIILGELIQMAKGLRIETVCEGVETKEQAEFLKSVGCTRLQGFYFSRPAPFE